MNKPLILEHVLYLGEELAQYLLEAKILLGTSVAWNEGRMRGFTTKVRTEHSTAGQAPLPQRQPQSLLVKPV